MKLQYANSVNTPDAAFVAKAFYPDKISDFTTEKSRRAVWRVSQGETPHTHSQLVQLDYDHVLEHYKRSEFLKTYVDPIVEHVYACYLSPSKDGIKVFLKVEGWTEETHSRNYDALISLISEKTGCKVANQDKKSKDWGLDTSCGDFKRKCYEPDKCLLVQEDATPFSLARIEKRLSYWKSLEKHQDALDLFKQEVLHHNKYQEKLWFQHLADSFPNHSMSQKEWSILAASLHKVPNGKALFDQISKKYTGGDVGDIDKIWKATDNYTRVTAGTFVHICKCFGVDTSLPNKIRKSKKSSKAYAAYGSEAEETSVESAEMSDKERRAYMISRLADKDGHNYIPAYMMDDTPALLDVVSKNTIVNIAKINDIVKSIRIEGGEEGTKKATKGDVWDGTQPYLMYYPSEKQEFILDKDKMPVVDEAYLHGDYSGTTRCINTYLPPGVFPYDANISERERELNLKVLKFLVHDCLGRGDKEQSDVIFGMLADAIQDPSDRGANVVQIYSEQGSFKGVFTEELMPRIFGGRNIKTKNNDGEGTQSEKNTEFMDCLFTVFKEGEMDAYQQALGQAFKQASVTKKLRVKRMYMESCEYPIFSRWIGEANPEAVVRINMNDRRITPIRASSFSKEERESAKYKEICNVMIDKMIKNPNSKFVRVAFEYLRDYDYSETYDKRECKITQGFRELVAQSYPAYIRTFIAWFNNEKEKADRNESIFLSKKSEGFYFMKNKSKEDEANEVEDAYDFYVKKAKEKGETKIVGSRKFRDALRQYLGATFKTEHITTYSKNQGLLFNISNIQNIESMEEKIYANDYNRVVKAWDSIWDWWNGKEPEPQNDNKEQIQPAVNPDEAENKQSNSQLGAQVENGGDAVAKTEGKPKPPPKKDNVDWVKATGGLYDENCMSVRPSSIESVIEEKKKDEVLEPKANPVKEQPVQEQPVQEETRKVVSNESSAQIEERLVELRKKKKELTGKEMDGDELSEQETKTLRQLKNEIIKLQEALPQVIDNERFADGEREVEKMFPSLGDDSFEWRITEKSFLHWTNYDGRYE